MTIPKLIIGSHNHVPISTNEESLEKRYACVFKPFISSLYRFPDIPMLLHYSGVLLNWFERKHPEFIMILSEMLGRKQIEILGGGFYEPIFPLIPLSDRIGQIELLTTFIRKNLGKRPRGCWIPGFAWEQNMTSAFHTAGMDYVLLESDQFLAAGSLANEIFRPRITEDLGKMITAFPIARELSECVRYEDPRSFVSALGKIKHNNADDVVVIFPDLYAAPRLIDDSSDDSSEDRFDAFFDALLKTVSPEMVTLPSRIVKRDRAYAPIYFPNSAISKEEDDHNCLTRTNGHYKENTTPSLGVTPYRNCLLRSVEINGLYSRMLYTHLLINQLRGDKYRKRSAREELWKAQGIDAYRLRFKDGIGDNNLRKAYYRAIIQAERMTREKGVFLPSIINCDIDLDNEKDYLIQGLVINCFIRSRGAVLYELDYLSKNWNYLDTFCAHSDRKAYAFVDHFLSHDCDLSHAVSGNFVKSRDCLDEWYEELEIDRSRQVLVLRKAPASDGGPYDQVEIVKKVSLKRNVVSVHYALLNQGKHTERFVFCPEINISLASGYPEIQAVRLGKATRLNSLELEPSEWRAVEELMIGDEANQLPIKLRTSLPFGLWIIPRKNQITDDDGCVDQYQHTEIWPTHSVVLKPGESWENLYSLRFGR